MSGERGHNDYPPPGLWSLIIVAAVVLVVIELVRGF